MASFMKAYYDTEGPYGLPMKDKQAQALDKRLQEVPREKAYEFRRWQLGGGLSELQAGERADVSWITEETPDRCGDVVLARGMDDAHFQLNPIVTLNHCYWQPPVGKSLWRRRLREGPRHGVKAKTHYPPRPANWPADDWLPDYAFELVRAGLLRGKSIGFFPLKVRAPTAEEIAQRPEMKKVRYVIEHWLLAEYACCYLPVQPNAVVEEVSKALPPFVAETLGMPKREEEKTEDRSQKTEVRSQKSEVRSQEIDRSQQEKHNLPSLQVGCGQEKKVIPFTSLGEVAKALVRQLQAIDPQKILQLTWPKALGIW